jgi:hypothetical protein
MFAWKWRQRLPFFVLLAMAASWLPYYLVPSEWNDFGAARQEWWLLIDGLIVLPLVCWLCIPQRKEALTKALLYACLMVLLGSWIIPEQHKLIWHWLEGGRYVLLLGFLVLELSAVLTVLLAIRLALKQGDDPDLAIQRPLQRWVGAGALSKLLAFEARVWTFALFASRIKPTMYRGEQHFSYHDKDAAQSNALGFLLLIALEMPLVHVLLHFVISAWFANLVTILTLLGAFFMWAEYCSMSRRPVSIHGDYLITRYALWPPVRVKLATIRSVRAHHGYVARSAQHRRFNYAGCPNLYLQLDSNGSGEQRDVYLGLDDPEQFIAALNAAR